MSPSRDATNPCWIAIEAHPGGEFRIGHIGDELVAEWSGLGRLTARRDGTAWRFDARPGAAPELIAKLRLGSIPSLLRHLRGGLALHGSALAPHDDAAVVFVGRSGKGKSTLSAWLCRELEAAFLADDAVSLHADDSGRWWVEPQEHHHYLTSSALEALNLPRNAEGPGKQRIPARHVATASRPLRSIVELVFDETTAPALHRLEGVEAIAALVPHAVRFVLDEPARVRRELEMLMDLLDSVAVWRFVRPMALDRLADASVVLAPLFEMQR